jgi:hypothetical protein
LSSDRANAIRKVLEEEGVPPGNLSVVSGRADTQPLSPDDPFVAAEPARDHHAAARGAADPGQSQALKLAAAGPCCFRRGGV